MGVNHDSVVGVLSLMAWALFITSSRSSVVLMMRAGNRSEGGVMALMALVRRSLDNEPRLRWLCSVWACSVPRCSTATT